MGKIFAASKERSRHEEDMSQESEWIRINLVVE
jgi:hypothetical protein